MIFCQISSTKSLSNRMEITLKNLTMFLNNNCLIPCLQIKSQWKETTPILHCCFHSGTDLQVGFPKR